MARIMGGGRTGRTLTPGESLPAVANTLTNRMHKGINTTCDEGQTLIPTREGGFFDDVTAPLTCRPYADNAGREDLLISHTLTSEGFDASPDGTGRGTPIIPTEPYTLAIRGRGDSHDLEYRQDGTANAILTPNGGRAGIGVGAIAFSCKDHGADAGDVAPTLRSMAQDEGNANAGGQIAIAFDCEQGGDTQHGYTEDGTPPLRGKSGRTCVAFDPTQITSPENRSQPKEGDPCHPLASAAHPPAVAFSGRSRGDDGRGYDRPPEVTGDRVGALDTVKPWNVAAGLAVRRLTPRECERLQGFPDDYTLIEFRGKPAADGPRYRALGNSKAVPVVRKIGERIALVETLQAENAAA